MNAPTAALAKPKGPIVWLDMDQQQLDDAYDQLVYAPNRDQLTKRRAANSAAARARIGEPLRFAYGPTPIEALDVYRPLSKNAAAGAAHGPVAIFVYGGAWRTARHPSSRSSPSRSCAPAPISRCSISSMSTMPAAICVRWSDKSAERSALSIATPKGSAATATGFI
jgi:acetyl esterase/lipase